MMTWEETIAYFQSMDDQRELMKNTYLDRDLSGNAERYFQSIEFSQTLDLIIKYAPDAKTILDVGAGNGICSIAFARKGFEIYSLEPDPGKITGRGAIEELKLHYQLEKPIIHSGKGEGLPFEDNFFDVVFIRQAVHHADNLQNFINECLRVLKTNGLLLAIREHVVFDDADKKMFFEQHPLHKYYGGENAYSLNEYLNAFTKAGGITLQTLKYFESPINYFPLTENDISKMEERRRNSENESLIIKLGKAGNSKLLQRIYHNYLTLKLGNTFDERRLPGRMYSFIVKKNPVNSLNF